MQKYENDYLNINSNVSLRDCCNKTKNSNHILDSEMFDRNNISSKLSKFVQYRKNSS